MLWKFSPAIALMEHAPGMRLWEWLLGYSLGIVALWIALLGVILPE
jgi:hypothetical protein